MTPITLPRAVVEQALEALELGHDSAKAEADRYHAAMAGYKLHRHAQMDAEVQQIAAAITALRAALAQQAEPVLQTCNCRWDGEVQVQQCALHEAHVDAIHEWAERAKVAERKLAQQAEPDWQDLYLKEKQRADMWRDKYESVAGAEQRIYLQAEPVEPVARLNKKISFDEAMRLKDQMPKGLFRRVDGQAADEIWLCAIEVAELHHGITDPKIEDHLARHGIPMLGDPK